MKKLAIILIVAIQLTAGQARAWVVTTTIAREFSAMGCFFIAAQFYHGTTFWGNAGGIAIKMAVCTMLAAAIENAVMSQEEQLTLRHARWLARKDPYLSNLSTVIGEDKVIDFLTLPPGHRNEGEFMRILNKSPLEYQN